jgi:Recombinase zinc beta ribbon domain
VVGGLRKHRPGAGRPSHYLLSGLLECDVCRAGFVLSNGTRYQCASHVNGGDRACDISLSVPRERVERVILDFTVAGLPRILEAVEARYRHPEHPADRGAEIKHLESQRERLLAAIKMGGELQGSGCPRIRMAAGICGSARRRRWPMTGCRSATRTATCRQSTGRVSTAPQWRRRLQLR